MSDLDMQNWNIVIGLEVHAQIKSKSKLFSKSATTFSLEPNTQVGFFDSAMPGTLPVLNPFCIEQAVKTGIALQCEIHEISLFDRKNYFYPDLPSGYQISQYYKPIATNGSIAIFDSEENKKNIRINRLHIEQDAGKLIHDLHPDYSLVDLNRSGVGLMEIVSEPDITSAEEAVNYIRKLRSILKYVDTCDGNMQEGSLRVDVNISVNRPGEPLGTRCEVKNINSFKFIKQAIDFESKRQIREIEKGNKINQETRLFNTKTGETNKLRDKEDAQEYRYFPDPDIPPVLLNKKELEDMRQSMPELPDVKIDRFVGKLGLSAYQADVITSEKEYVDYFESMIGSHKIDPKIAANWMLSELFGLINKAEISLNECKVKAKELASLVLNIGEGKISTKQGKDVLKLMFEEGAGANDAIAKLGVEQITDEAELEKVVKSVIESNKEEAQKAKEGDNRIFSWMLGQAIKSTKGKANPSIIKELLKKLL